MKRIDENISLDICGIEVEYGFVDSGGVPVGMIGGVSLIEALDACLNSKHSLAKDVAACGGFKEEVFKHQIETVTKPGVIEIVECAALELHDILLMIMKEEFGLVPSSQQPIPFPGGGVELLTEKQYFIDSMKSVNSKGLIQNYVSNKDYYKDAVVEIMGASGGDGLLDSFSFARNASTTSIHLHRSRKSPQETLKLWYALMHTTSKDILTNNESWYTKYGMSNDRFTQWSKIVAVRECLGEVLNPIDFPLIPELKDDWLSFCLDRYFGGGKISTTPTRDHGPWAIKSPGGLTVEGRTYDGPGDSKALIKKAISGYIQLTHESIDCFNSGLRT